MNVDFTHLAARATYGNAHMMTIEKNSDATAALIADWVGTRVH